MTWGDPEWRQPLSRALENRWNFSRRGEERKVSCLGKDMSVVYCDWWVGAVLILALNLHDALPIFIH